MMMPTPASIATVTQRLRSALSIASCKSRPKITIGTEPRITSQPIRASGSWRGTRPSRDRDQALMMAADVLREVQDHRGLGAEWGDGGEGRTGVVPAETLSDDGDVRTAGDRQELGESLHDAEDQCLEPTHCPPSIVRRHLRFVKGPHHRRAWGRVRGPRLRGVSKIALTSPRPNAARARRLRRE